MKKENNYFNIIGENLFDFNLQKFIDIQTDIYTRFIPPTPDYFERIDSLLFQTLEEKFEIEMETDKVCKMEEIVDMLMYLGSLYASVISYDDNIYMKNGSYSRINTCNTITLNNSLINNNIFEEIEYDLFVMRRLYPERKWHKSIDEKSINYLERSIISSNIIIKCMYKIIEYIPNNYFYNISNTDIDKTIDVINNLIYNKQKFILNL